MHELVPGARVEGQIRSGRRRCVRWREWIRVRLRRRVGMVFQKPNPFPSMSVSVMILSIDPSRAGDGERSGW